MSCGYFLRFYCSFGCFTTYIFFYLPPLSLCVSLLLLLSLSLSFSLSLSLYIYIYICVYIVDQVAFLTM